METPRPENTQEHCFHMYRWYYVLGDNLTDNQPVAEEQLMELGRKGREQTSQGCQKPSNDGCQPCRFAPAKPDRQRRQSQ